MLPWRLIWEAVCFYSCIVVSFLWIGVVFQVLIWTREWGVPDILRIVICLAIYVFMLWFTWVWLFRRLTDGRRQRTQRPKVDTEV